MRERPSAPRRRRMISQYSFRYPTQLYACRQETCDLHRSLAEQGNVRVLALAEHMPRIDQQADQIDTISDSCSPGVTPQQSRR
jgi:hypothetical protein